MSSSFIMLFSEQPSRLYEDRRQRRDIKFILFRLRENAMLLLRCLLHCVYSTSGYDIVYWIDGVERNLHSKRKLLLSNDIRYLESG